MSDPIQATCVHDDGYEHPSDGTLPCPLVLADAPAVTAFPRGVADPECPRGHVIETTTDHRLLWHLENTLAVAATNDTLRETARDLRRYLNETCQHHWHEHAAEGEIPARRQCLWCNVVTLEPGDSEALYYCGCCGDEISGGNPDWCDRCLPHIAAKGALWDRTYFAQHNAACPYQVTSEANADA